MEAESLVCVSTVHPDIVKPVRRLVCCCCGGSITGRQFHNQDTGHGLGEGPTALRVCTTSSILWFSFVSQMAGSGRNGGSAYA